MGVADAASERAHMFAINQHRHSQGFKNLLDERGDQMGGPLLVLQSPGKVSRNPGELGQSQDLLVGDIFYFYICTVFKVLFFDVITYNSINIQHFTNKYISLKLRKL